MSAFEIVRIVYGGVAIAISLVALVLLMLRGDF